MKANYLISSITLSIILLIYITFDLGDFIYKVIPVDTFSYIKASDMLYNDLVPHPTRPLGYALISGLPNLVFSNLNDNYYISFGVFLNLISWITSLVFFNKTLRLFFTPKFSFLVSLIPMFSFGGVFSVFWMLTEPIIVLFLSLISFSLSKYVKKDDIKHLIVATSLLNFATLVKPGFIYLGLTASIALIIYLTQDNRNKNIKIPAILFITSLIFITLQAGIMYKTYDKVTVSFIDKITWYYYLGSESEAEAEGIPLDTIRELRRQELSGKSLSEQSRIISSDMKRQIRENTYIVFKNWGLNIIENSKSGNSIIFSIRNELKQKYMKLFTTLLLITTILQNISFILILLFCAFLMAKKYFKYNIAILLLTALLFYVIITSGISFSQGDRFHYPLYQSIIIIFLLTMKDSVYAKQWLRQQ